MDEKRKTGNVQYITGGYVLDMGGVGMRVLAIIPVYNEADILPGVLRHLHSQGVDTYVIDNWSTDETGSLVQAIGRGVRHSYQPKIYYERFPVGPVAVYQWERILRRVEEVALEFSGRYDWMMLHDVDEVRRVPVGGPDLTLAKAIHKLVDAMDYNVIDFKVYNFPPVDNGFVPGSDPERYFTRCYPASSYDKVAQEKAWKCYPGVGVDLASTGGHKVKYKPLTVEDTGISATGVVTRNVCPHKFILKHYPVRSQAHGERKVFEERRKRWHLGERGKNWHTQYDAVEVGHNFLADPTGLVPDPYPPAL